jgi:hypothetical protein
LQQLYLKRKAGALIGGILLLAFFLLKDGIWTPTLFSLRLPTAGRA